VDTINCAIIFCTLIFLVAYGRKTGAYKIWRGDLKGRDPLGRRKRRWEDNTKILKKWNGKAQTGLIWLRRGTGGRRL